MASSLENPLLADNSEQFIPTLVALEECQQFIPTSVALEERFARIEHRVVALENVGKPKTATTDVATPMKPKDCFFVKQGFVNLKGQRLGKGEWGQVMKRTADGADVIMFATKYELHVEKADFGKLVVHSWHDLIYCGEPLSKLAYPPEFLEIEPKFNMNDSCTAGPALLWAFKCLLFTVILFVATPFIAFGTTRQCPERGFAMVPTWLYLPLGVAIVSVVWLEERVKYYSLAPYLLALATDNGFTCWGFNVSFPMWLWYSRAMSLIAHADIVTSGVFVAKAVLSDACGTTRQEWTRAMGSSTFGAIVGRRPFSVFAVVGWFLILSQFIYAFTVTWVLKNPSKRKQCDFQRHGHDDVHYEIVYSEHDYLSYSTLLLKYTDHAASLQIVAHAGRMAAVESQYNRYLVNSIYDIATYHGALKNIFVNFILHGLLQTAYQLKLQSSGLALARATDAHDRLDWQMLLSMGLCFFIAFKNAYYKLHDFMLIRKKLEDMVELKFRNVKNMQLSREQSKLSREHDLAASRSILMFFLCLVVIYLVCVLMSMFQAYKTVFVCREGLYNFGQGCVHNEIL